MNAKPDAALAPKLYRVGDLVIDVGRGRVTRNDMELAVTGLSFKVLLELIRAAPNLISINELIEFAWSGAVVSPETVIQRVKMLRQSLGDEAEHSRYIATVRGRGYRLLPKIEQLSEDERVAVQQQPGMAPFRHRIVWAAVGILVAAVVITWGWMRLTKETAAGATGARTVYATSVGPRTAVAVLPFLNLTGDPSKDYLGEGMAAELINMLSKVPGLRVPARTSTFAYKRRDADAKQIAHDLNVGTLLDGTVRSAGDSVRITAELIDAQTDSHLWSETFEAKSTDLFKLQDEIASAMVKALEPNLNAPASIAQMPPTHDVEAYRLYLQGEALKDRGGEQVQYDAIRFFEQAVARDPNFARAWAGLAEAYMGTMTLQLVQLNPADNLNAAETAARRALALAPSQAASAELALAGIAGIRGNFIDSELHRQIARTMAQGDGGYRAQYANQRAWTGHLQDSLRETQVAFALAPANPRVAVYLSQAYSNLALYTDAGKYADLAVSLGYSKSVAPLADVYARDALRAGQYDNARDARIAMLTADDYRPRATRVITAVYDSLSDPGKRGAALAARDYLFPSTNAPKGATVNKTSCLTAAYSYVLIAAVDAAFESAQDCLGDNPVWLVASPRPIAELWTPEMRAFRQDPRFQTYLERIGLMKYYEKFGPPDDCELNNGRLTCH